MSDKEALRYRVRTSWPPIPARKASIRIHPIGSKGRSVDGHGKKGGTGRTTDILIRL